MERRRMNKRYFILPLFFLISGCAISNQGAIDYRFNRPGQEDGYLSPKYINVDEASHKIQAGDAISVTLKQVFLNDLEEWRSVLRIARSEPATADVAIVASTCESPCARKFGVEGIKNSKVIFYSNDVREKQFLNLSNLHGVYGPITYNGRPFKIDIYVIELDESGEKTRNLLGSLANLGQTFYPPAHPAAAVLSTLAETFIQDDQDDNVFTYSFDLAGQNTISNERNPNTAYLEAGDYVLIRSEDRTKQVPWGNLALNKSVGRVVKREGNCATTREPDQTCYYTENSYVVLGVSRAGGSVANDSQQIVFSALRNHLDGSSGNMEISSQEIEEIKKSLESAEVRKKAEGSFEDIIDSTPDTAERMEAILSFVSIWFEQGATVNDKDKAIVVDAANKLLAQCAGLSISDMTAYQDNISSRSIQNREPLMSALSVCR